jgi:uncharacterized membrane protein YfhO
MKKLIKKISKWEIWNKKELCAFLLSFFLGCLIIIPNIIINKGIFVLTADLNVQQIPFLKAINASLKSGNFLWTWYNGLGSNFISTFSFYNLFSPFNIITYFFPSNLIEYLIGPIYILKYAVAGLTSYLFLNRYVKNKNLAILGSLLYAFSGFQLTNTLFYHFHDVVAFFPLVLYTLDNLVINNKKGWFGLSIVLMALTNWFFLIGTCVFTLIYFLIKIITKEYKINLKKFLQVAFEAICGILIAAFVLIPSFLFTLNNPRLGTNWTINNMLIYSSKSTYFNIIKSLVMPSDVMNSRSLLFATDYTSIEAYLPVVGVILSSTYIFKNKKNWISIICVLLIIMMLVPIFNSSFFAFQTAYYARWFYCPILMLSLASIKTLDENINYKPGLIINFIFMILLLCGILYVIYKIPTKQIVYNSNYLIISIIFFIISYIFMYVIIDKKKKIFSIIIAIILFITFWGNYTIYTYKGNTFKNIDYYKQYLLVSNILKLEKNSRSNSSSGCEYNYGYLSKINNIKEWNSNIEGSNFELYNSLGIYRGVSTIIPESDKNINDFLSVKYLISCGEDLSKYGYIYQYSNDYLKIYLNPNYKNFGFSNSKYMSIDDFNKLSFDERKQIINEYTILTNEQILRYKDLFVKKIKYSKNDFTFQNNGFNSYIETNKDALAIYTIPYDTGWIATNNGQSTKIEKVDNGVMAVKINKGQNSIKFNFITPGLKIGAKISALTIVIYLLYIIFYRKNDKVQYNFSKINKNIMQHK